MGRDSGQTMNGVSTPSSPRGRPTTLSGRPTLTKRSISSSAVTNQKAPISRLATPKRVPPQAKPTTPRAMTPRVTTPRPTTPRATTTTPRSTASALTSPRSPPIPTSQRSTTPKRPTPVSLTPRQTSTSLTPRSTTSLTPRQTTPRAITPRATTPRSVPSKPITPRASTPTRKSAPTTSLTPRSTTPRVARAVVTAPRDTLTPRARSMPPARARSAPREPRRPNPAPVIPTPQISPIEPPEPQQVPADEDAISTLKVQLSGGGSMSSRTRVMNEVAVKFGLGSQNKSIGVLSSSESSDDEPEPYLRSRRGSDLMAATKWGSEDEVDALQFPSQSDAQKRAVSVSPGRHGYGKVSLLVAARQGSEPNIWIPETAPSPPPQPQSSLATSGWQPKRVEDILSGDMSSMSPDELRNALVAAASQMAQVQREAQQLREQLRATSTQRAASTPPAPREPIIPTEDATSHLPQIFSSRRESQPSSSTKQKGALKSTPSRGLVEKIASVFSHASDDSDDQDEARDVLGDITSSFSLRDAKPKLKKRVSFSDD
eukprot:c17280_g1_i2.p1 GENE.c17280_g1_i2~~c17280_g1_i2.p1  ORF type:complete len:544 (+),score=21.79 c17280_g1_i2:1-1632(+)